jgi:hypothetical protein
LAWEYSNRYSDQATDCRTEGPWFNSQQRGKGFSVLQIVSTDSGAHSEFYSPVDGDYFRRCELSGCEADHWLRFSTEIRVQRSYVSIPPYGFMSHTFTNFISIALFSGAYTASCSKNVKIPRPQNAFLVYANEMRVKLAVLYPQEKNTQISKR